VELQKVCGETPCLEDFKALHQRIMLLWKIESPAGSDFRRLDRNRIPGEMKSP
jgi:hypothetical protein